MEGSPLVHEHIKQNVHTSFSVDVGNYDQAANQADHRLRRKITFPRIHSNPLETRGVVTSYDRRTEELTMYTSTQIPFVVKSYLSRMLHLPLDHVRVLSLIHI